jgi:hypothetical protein
MIDYNKLKQAHELGASLSNSIDYPVFIAVQQEERFEGEICVLYTFRAAGDARIYRNIDDLITNLQKLTQPKPKYKNCKDCYYYWPPIDQRKECQHESDGHYYGNPVSPPNNKCKKCGEFYR